jgi:hypothetical protein
MNPRIASALLVLACVLAPAAFAQAPVKPAGAACLVSHFRAVVLSTHDVELRANRAEEWLRKYSPVCTTEQLNAIKGNAPSWLGHALTPELSGIIEGLVETKVAGNPALMGQLYESVGKEMKAGAEVTRTPTARAPVVVPPIVQGGIMGAANFGTVNGPSTAVSNLNAAQLNQAPVAGGMVVNPAAPPPVAFPSTLTDPSTR